MHQLANLLSARYHRLSFLLLLQNKWDTFIRFLKTKLMEVHQPQLSHPPRWLEPIHLRWRRQSPPRHQAPHHHLQLQPWALEPLALQYEGCWIEFLEEH
jgi:hypothetical protein